MTDQHLVITGSDSSTGAPNDTSILRDDVLAIGPTRPTTLDAKKTFEWVRSLSLLDSMDVMRAIPPLTANPNRDNRILLVTTHAECSQILKAVAALPGVEREEFLGYMTDSEQNVFRIGPTEKPQSENSFSAPATYEVLKLPSGNLLTYNSLADYFWYRFFIQPNFLDVAPASLSVPSAILSSGSVRGHDYHGGPNFTYSCQQILERISDRYGVALHLEPYEELLERIKTLAIPKFDNASTAALFPLMPPNL